MVCRMCISVSTSLWGENPKRTTSRLCWKQSGSWWTQSVWCPTGCTTSSSGTVTLAPLTILDFLMKSRSLTSMTHSLTWTTSDPVFQSTRSKWTPKIPRNYFRRSSKCSLENKSERCIENNLYATGWSSKTLCSRDRRWKKTKNLPRSERK